MDEDFARVMAKFCLSSLDDYPNRAEPLALKSDTQTSNSPEDLGSCGDDRLSSEYELKYSDISFGKELDTGTFGTVHRAVLHRSYRGHTEVAVKTVTNLNPEEIDILKKFMDDHHQNIIQFLGYIKHLSNHLIITELARRGSLFQYLSHDPDQMLPIFVVQKWVGDIAAGIKFLHDRNVVHRDIKSPNCLLSENCLVKICDFGIARERENSAQTMSLKGSVRWMAPEMIGNFSYSKPSDVYSFGMVTLEICTRKVPFAGELERLVVMRDAQKKPSIPSHCPEFLKQLMQECWQGDPHHRPTIDGIVKLLEKECKVSEESERRLHEWEQENFTQDYGISSLVSNENGVVKQYSAQAEGMVVRECAQREAAVFLENHRVPEVKPEARHAGATKEDISGDTPQVTPEVTNRATLGDTFEGTQQGTPKATPRATIEDIPEDTPTPKFTNGALLGDTSERTQQVTPKATLRATIEDIPEDTPTSKVTNGATLEDTSERTQQVTSKATPRATIEVVPEDTPTTKVTNGATLGDTSERTQQVTSKATPRATIEVVPEDTPTTKVTNGATLGDTSESTQQVTPKATLRATIEDIPEDMPKTKVINGATSGDTSERAQQDTSETTSAAKSEGEFLETSGDTPGVMTEVTIVEAARKHICNKECKLSICRCDLQMQIFEDGFSGKPLSEGGFAYMWAGVKATHGVTAGRVCFDVEVTEDLDVGHLPPEEEDRHIVRVGWSNAKSGLLLGKHKLSYGYGGTAFKSSWDCGFEKYGETFGKGDVITSYLDFSGQTPIISFAKNGEDLGEAYSIKGDDMQEEAWYPHVFLKNAAIEINLGQKEPSFPLKEGFTYLRQLPEQYCILGPQPPASKEDCEVLMMIGLSGSGKTTWVRDYCRRNPHKNYVILGTNQIMESMRVKNLRRRSYMERFNRLINDANVCFDRLLEVASKRNQNYIIDQMNLTPSARRKKLMPLFKEFCRKAIVVIPSLEDYRKQVKKQKLDGKDIPDKEVKRMIVDFKLPEDPEDDPIFREVQYVELQKDKATELLISFKEKILLPEGQVLSMLS